MIAVIADDLTGAAEMGGLGLHHGLSTEVQTHRYVEPRSDLVVFDTDSRSMRGEQAQDATRVVAGRVREADLLYKKVDSVMRGNILAELETLLITLGKDRALLIPANPTLGRTIVRGEYFVGGVPVHMTDFSRDPEHPVTTSRVLELLGDSRCFDLGVMDDPQRVPKGSIVIGEAQKWDDLRGWAGCLEDSSIPAGGSDFFGAVLDVRGLQRVPRRGPGPPSASSLFVCGSSSEYSKQTVRRAETRGLPVCWMSQQILRGEADKHLDRWAETTSGQLDQHSLAIVALGHLPDRSNTALANTLRDHMAALVKRVLRTDAIQELYIEGGATSSSIVREMGWNRFFPTEELARGVVRMEVEGEETLHMTIKPGSYIWPREVVLGQLG